MAEKLKLGIGQMTTTDSIQKNTEVMIQLMQSQGPVDLWSFPENCLFYRADSLDPIAKIKISDASISQLQMTVDELNCDVHLGSVPLTKAEGLFNSTIWLSPRREPQIVYDKIHLFDVDVGGTKLRESDAFTPGHRPHIVDFKGWKIGLSICYDLRFSDLYHRYARANVDLILVPSAFLVETGKVHWEILLRARAIESQCFVAAAAQSGEHQFSNGKKRRTYGNSMCVHPWGNILWRSEKEGIDSYVVEMDKGEIEKVRSQIPMPNHRRLHRSENS